MYAYYARVARPLHSGASTHRFTHTELLWHVFWALRLKTVMVSKPTRISMQTKPALLRHTCLPTFCVRPTSSLRNRLRTTETVLETLLETVGF